MFFARALKLAKNISKENLSSNCSNGQLECTFDKHGDIFLSESNIFLSESPKVINKILQPFSKKIYNSRSSYGHDECSFDNPVDKQSTKSRRFFAQCPKKMGEKLKADTSQYIPFARWNAVLTTQSKNFQTKVKTFRSMSEQENVRFSSESFSAQLVPMYTWKAVFTTLSNRLSQIADGVLPNIWKVYAFFFKMLLWTRRRQFWQPHQKNFRQKPKTNRSRSEKNW